MLEIARAGRKGAQLLLPLLLCTAVPVALPAQAPAGQSSAPGSASVVRGTVKSADGTAMTVQTDAGPLVTISTAGNVRVQQLPAGSTDLKSAQPAELSAIGAGDRVLISTRAGDGGALTATRVIVMKGAEIAQRNEAARADWQRRGSGGVVKAVDAAAGTITVSAGARERTVKVQPNTVIRQYAAGSVKFEDAKLSTLAAIQPGDQLRVRGDRSADGAGITADEIVFGSFRNLSGTVSKVDAGAGTLTIKDRSSGKEVAVTVPADADLRTLPPEIAARLNARGSGKAGSPGNAGGGAASAGAGAAPAEHAAESRAGRGNDLSQMLDSFPKLNLAEVKPGQSLMIVASGDAGSSSPPAAVVVLAGVDSILAAVPAGGQPVTLSPWNLGGGGDAAQ